MKHILVTGLIRSGTTWLGSVLATAKGTIYLHEPFNPTSHWNAACPFPHYYHCVTARTGPYYAPNVHSILRLEPLIRAGWMDVAIERCRADVEAAEAAPRNAGIPRSDLRVIFKDPIALYSSEWLFQAFSMAPLVILRHPVRVAKSLLRLGWGAGNLHIRNQPDLVERFYGEDDSMLVADTRRMKDLDAADKACVRIKHWLHAAAVLLRDHPEWGFLDYTSLCRDPMPQFTSLFDRLKLEPSAETWERVGRGEPGVYQAGLQTQKTLMPVPEDEDELFRPAHGVDDWERRFEEHFREVTERLRPIVTW